MADDPILKSKTVTELVTALNARFHWNLPISFSVGSVLSWLWSLKIKVMKSPTKRLLYKATTTDGKLRIAPALEGTFFIEVVDEERRDPRET